MKAQLGNRKSPLVSVVVPAYNNASFIEATIASILAQDFDDFELVIADHSSSDATQSIISGHAKHPRVRILPPTPKGGGALANWSRVSSEAQGKYIKLVCGDDLIAPTALTEQVRALHENPSCVLVASMRELIDAHGETVIRKRGLGSLNGLVSGREAIRATVLAGTNIFGEPGCVMFRREILDRVGGWDSTFPYLIDQATYVRIIEHGDVFAIRKPLASFRISSSQWSVRLMAQQSKQAIAFHRDLQRRHPCLFSSVEVALADSRAILASLKRRAAYLALRRRM